MQVAYTWIGVVVALILIGLPFVVRSVQPALIEVQRDLEDAAETLGQAPADLPPDHPARGAAGGPDRVYARLRARHRRVRVGGVHLGNLPMKTEITPLLIVIKLEQFEYGRRGARARDAGDVLRHAVRDQPGAGLGPPTSAGR